MTDIDLEIDLTQNAFQIFYQFLTIIYVENADDPSAIFNWAMLALFGYVVIIFLTTNASKEVNTAASRFVFSNAPAIFINTGLTGTFFGISIALLGFDVDQIENSIPTMIEGMRFAFLTSFVGVFLSLLSTVLLRYRQAQFSTGGPDDDFADVRAIEALESKTEDCLNRIEKALVGRSPGSLINVVEKIEQANNTNSGRVISKLDQINNNIESSLAGADFESNHNTVLERLSTLVGVAELIEKNGNDRAATVVEQFELINEALVSTVEKATLVDEFVAALERLNTVLTSLQEQRDLSTQQIEAVARNVESVIDSASERMSEQFARVNEAAYTGLSSSVDKQLTEVTDSLASGLEQIIEKFIKDLSRLTELLAIRGGDDETS